MSRLGKRFIAKKKYFDYKSEYMSNYGSLDYRIKDFNISDYNNLVLLLGQWRGLHKLFLAERKYGHRYRNKNRTKLRDYHRHYKRRKKWEQGISKSYITGQQ